MTRIPLARTPNWKITDPDDIKSEWWTWKNPDKPFDNYATINGQRRHLAFDKDHINTDQPQDYYEDAIVWTTKGWVMGSPFQARVLAADRENGLADLRRAVGRRAVLQDHPRLPVLPGRQAAVPRQPRRVLVRQEGRRRPAVPPPARRPGPEPGPRRGGQAHPRDREPRHEPRPRPRAHLPLHQRLLEPDCRALLGVAREHRRASPAACACWAAAPTSQVTHCTFEHVHRGVRLKAEGPAGRHRPGGGERQRLLRRRRRRRGALRRHDSKHVILTSRCAET